MDCGGGGATTDTDIPFGWRSDRGRSLRPERSEHLLTDLSWRDDLPRPVLFTVVSPNSLRFHCGPSTRTAIAETWNVRVAGNLSRIEIDNTRSARKDEHPRRLPNSLKTLPRDTDLYVTSSMLSVLAEGDRPELGMAESTSVRKLNEFPDMKVASSLRTLDDAGSRSSSRM